jgi:hypothetical protein
MKRFAVSLSSGLLLLCMLGGCHTATITPPTTALAPGYLNAADQQMGEILSGARAFYTSIQTQSATGKITLTPAVKTSFNAFGVALNSAEAVYLAYHNGTATQAAAQTAVNTVQSQQAALPLPGAK